MQTAPPLFLLSTQQKTNIPSFFPLCTHSVDTSRHLPGSQQSKKINRLPDEKRENNPRNGENMTSRVFLSFTRPWAPQQRERARRPWAPRRRGQPQQGRQRAQPRTKSRESARVSFLLERFVIVIRRNNSSIAYQVVAQQLHDQGRVLVALLGQCVELCANMLVNCQAWNRMICRDTHQQ